MKDRGFVLAFASLALAGGCGGRVGTVTVYVDGGPASEQGGDNPLGGGAPAHPEAGGMVSTTLAGEASANDDESDDASGDATVASGSCAYTTTTLASGQSGPAGIAVDSAYAYWVTHDGSTVMRVPLTGGTASVLASEQGQPHGIAVDATGVYWTNNASGTVMKAALPSGALATIASGQPGAQGVTLDSTYAYWTLGNSGYSAVMKVPSGGAGATVVASGGNGPQGVAVDGTHVYWTTFYSSTVEEALLTGGTPTVLATGQSWPEGIALYGTSVYWTTNGTVMALDLAGGSPMTLATAQNNPSAGGVNTDIGIAVDARFVYWADYGDGFVMTVPRAGGASIRLASGGNPLGIAIDDTYVYWTDYARGTVMKTLKCEPQADPPP